MSKSARRKYASKVSMFGTWLDLSRDPFPPPCNPADPRIKAPGQTPHPFPRSTWEQPTRNRRRSRDLLGSNYGGSAQTIDLPPMDFQDRQPIPQCSENIHGILASPAAAAIPFIEIQRAGSRRKERLQRGNLRHNICPINPPLSHQLHNTLNMPKFTPVHPWIYFSLILKKSINMLGKKIKISINTIYLLHIY